ncbi:MAG TPA: sulfatase-like hydrolase/transferase [Kofleriaceae bacterium]|nr:sulfatase-like hydrolase/transferase [Kofleriaceae bacterium]
MAALAVVVAAFYDEAGAFAGVTRFAAGAGFAVLVAWPAAFVISLLARMITHVWQPRALAASLTDLGGGAPRLAAWLVAIGLGAVLLSIFTHQVVWIFWRTTAFKPRSMSMALGPVMIVIVAIVVLLTRVMAAALGALLTRRGGRWLTPSRVLGLAAALALAAAAVGWHLAIRKQFANVSFAGFQFPLIALALLVAVHVARAPFASRARRARVIAGGAAVVLATALATTALWARQSRPTMVLSLWGADGFSADAIDLIYNLYAIRDDVPMSDLTPTPRAGATRRDILLITIDTFRPDRIRPYGGPLPTPSLTALGNRGMVFEWAFAPSNVTRRSMPAIATGLAPTRVRGRVNGWALRMDPRHITLAERLRAGGYATTGLFCCEGFWERRRRLGLDRGIDDLFIRHDGQDLVAAYRERTAARRPDGPPTFTWIHFIELHEWAGGNPDLSPERRRFYDDLLGQIDRWVGELVTASEALPPERRPIIIITGDHSEAFGDHGQPFHSSDLYNSQIRVPLIIAGPQVSATRVHEAVSLVDLAPTILDLAGFVAPAFPQMDGRSLADLITGARHPDPEAGEAYAATIVDRYVRDRRTSLVRGRWKLIHQLGRWELYDLRTDANELRDLAPSNPEPLQGLQDAMRARWERDRVTPFR